MLRGRGFESQYWMHIFHICCTKNLTVCLKRPKINKKESGMAHFKKKNTAVKFEVLKRERKRDSNGEMQM